MNLTEIQSKPKFSIHPDSTLSALHMQPAKNDLDHLTRFKTALDDLFVRGLDLRSQENAAQGKATVALSKILGIAQDIYGKAGITEKEELMAHLRKRCRANGLKTITKRTTIFHLLSRQLRGSDTKQASSDAKILDRADKDGQTEQTFCEWVTSLGGLNSIKNEKSTVRAKNTNVATQKNDKPFLKWRCVTSISENVPDALKELDVGVNYTIVRHSDGRIDISILEAAKSIDEELAPIPVVTESTPT